MFGIKKVKGKIISLIASGGFNDSSYESDEELREAEGYLFHSNDEYRRSFYLYLYKNIVISVEENGQERLVNIKDYYSEEYMNIGDTVILAYNKRKDTYDIISVFS